MRKTLNHTGFTLIELSIALVIIGLLVGLGAKAIGPMITFAKVRETRDLLDSNVQSIFSWASSKNAIPNKDEFSSVAKSPTDAWGRKFIFMYYSSLSRINPTKDTICGRRSTDLKLYTNYSSSNVAFAVISRADNAAFSSKLNGVAITDSGAASGTINSSGTNGDIIRWVTLDELRSKIGCQGAPLKILNNELPFGKNGDKYSAKILADGGNGSGSYQWRINGDVPPTGITGTALPLINSTTWTTAPFMNITGHPQQSGSYLFSIDVQDNIGNTNSKSFVLTVNP